MASHQQITPTILWDIKTLKALWSLKYEPLHSSVYSSKTFASSNEVSDHEIYDVMFCTNTLC